MGLSKRRCANCVHYWRGAPKQCGAWIYEYGRCYQQGLENPPRPTHANCCGCKKYVDKNVSQLSAIGMALDEG